MCGKIQMSWRPKFNWRSLDRVLMQTGQKARLGQVVSERCNGASKTTADRQEGNGARAGFKAGGLAGADRN